jgi:hypothetical protein
MSGIISPVAAGGITAQATTPVGGVPLINGTQIVLTWNVPNDGKLHYLQVFASMTITTATTGGWIGLYFTAPDNSAAEYDILSGTQAVGFNESIQSFPFICRAGTTVTVRQETAMTAGAATLWASIWGS